MTDCTVLYGRKNLVGVYHDGKLVATHDKHTKSNGDLERYLKRLEKEGYKVTESQAEFGKFTDIPRELEVHGCRYTPEAPDEPVKAAETPRGAGGAALNGTVKAEGTVSRASADASASQASEAGAPTPAAEKPAEPKRSTLSRKK